MLILASRSPARLELLKKAGYTPDNTVSADIDEIPRKGELPRNLVHRLSYEKATQVLEKYPKSYVVAADTVIALGRRIIGKASNSEEAEKTLKLLSGRKHKVYTGVTIVSPKSVIKTKVIVTSVKFKSLENKEIEEYLNSNEWQEKSGCYAIQGIASKFIISINGSFSSVVGLPVYETIMMLKAMGYENST